MVIYFIDTEKHLIESYTLSDMIRFREGEFVVLNEYWYKINQVGYKLVDGQISNPINLSQYIYVEKRNKIEVDVKSLFVQAPINYPV